MSEAAGVALVKSPWTETLRNLISHAHNDLLICCPFVKRFATKIVLASLGSPTSTRPVRTCLITDLRPESCLANGMDLEAITELGKGVSDFELIHLPSTHAKVYVADWNRAIVTSGNLTQPGLCGNIEYGVSFSNETLVREVRTDVEGYGRLGALVALQDVESLTLEMEELRKLFQRAENSIRSQARNAFREKLEATRNQVLRQRAKGKTTHAIFSETVLFLLGKKAMRTEELHPAIKLLHPDLCDDSIDRVIDRVHFGKKWKHYVRNAQQSLKRLGRIRFKDGYWHLLSP